MLSYIHIFQTRIVSQVFKRNETHERLMLITELPKKASYSPGYFSKPTQLNDETYLL